MDLSGLYATVQRTWHTCRATLYAYQYFSRITIFCRVLRESRKFAGVVWQYAKFPHFLAHPVVKGGPGRNPSSNFCIHIQCPPHGLRSGCAERASITITNAEADVSSFLGTMCLLLPPVEMYRLHWLKQSGKFATTMYWETFETTCKHFLALIQRNTRH